MDIFTQIRTFMPLTNMIFASRSRLQSEVVVLYQKKHFRQKENTSKSREGEEEDVKLNDVKESMKKAGHIEDGFDDWKMCDVLRMCQKRIAFFNGERCMCFIAKVEIQRK